MKSRDLKDAIMSSEKHQIQIHLLKGFHVQNNVGGDHSMEEKVGSLGPQAQGHAYILDIYIYIYIHIHVDRTSLYIKYNICLYIHIGPL